MPSERSRAFFGILLILGLFVFVSYLVRTNIGFFQSFIGDSYRGAFAYIIITIIAVVIAPVSMVPIIPIASNLFGWFYTGLLNIVGWSIGSFIVFFICRKYGVSLVKKLVSLEEIEKLESKIPKENMFIDLVLLRMIFPVDLLSYFLSLFSKVNFRIYSISTIVGITPFAFVFSYLGVIPLYYQIIGFVTIVLLITIIHFIREIKKSTSH